MNKTQLALLLLRTEGERSAAAWADFFQRIEQSKSRRRRNRR